MTTLAETVLPLISTDADLTDATIAHNQALRMHRAIDLLEGWSEDPTEKYRVCGVALERAIGLMSGAANARNEIVQACRRLLRLHPMLAAEAHIATDRLALWVVCHQFFSVYRYFSFDPIAYAPALGLDGMVEYEKLLDRMEAMLGLRPCEGGPDDADARLRWTAMDRQRQRMALYHRDPEAILRAHHRHAAPARAMLGSARALEEIGEIDRAIKCARRGAEHDHSKWALLAARSWLSMAERYRPDEKSAALLAVFRLSPTSENATNLFLSVEALEWDEWRFEVLATLEEEPAEAVRFVLATIKDLRHAWDLAHLLGLNDLGLWGDLVRDYREIDRPATVRVRIWLLEEALRCAKVRVYEGVAAQLAEMLSETAGTAQFTAVEEAITDFRARYRRRPRMLAAFDEVALP